MSSRRRAAVRCGVVLGALGGAFGLAGCGETVQTSPAGGGAKSARMPEWNPNNSVFLAPGWTPGDRAQWEVQLRTRAQLQNDYVGTK